MFMAIVREEIFVVFANLDFARNFRSRARKRLVKFVHGTYGHRDEKCCEHG